jgi:hypothetical protein
MSYRLLAGPYHSSPPSTSAAPKPVTEACYGLAITLVYHRLKSLIVNGLYS